jgi:hypothetical protein
MFELNLYIIFKKHKSNTRRMLMNIKRNNLVSSWGPSLASTKTYQNNKAIKEVGSSKVKFNIHYETNQCCGFPIQASKFYENPSCVSCFLVGTLPHVYYCRKNP